MPLALVLHEHTCACGRRMKCTHPACAGKEIACVVCKAKAIERAQSGAAFLVPLSQEDWRLIEKTAGARQRFKRGARITDQRITTKMTSERVDAIGIAGELAAARFFNVEWDASHRPHGDRWDLTLAGQRTEVKATEYGHGVLLVPFKDPALWQLIVLVIGELRAPALRLAGWLTHGSWTQLRYDGRPRCDGWCVSQGKLRPMAELVGRHATWEQGHG